MWRERFLPVNTGVKKVIVTTENAVEVATNYQNDVLNIETASLNVQMESWIIENGAPQESVSLNIRLAYLNWQLKISNNYEVLKNEKVEIVEPPIVLGYVYSVNERRSEVHVSKEVLNLFNMPVTIGLAYALH